MGDGDFIRALKNRGYSASKPSVAATEGYFLPQAAMLTGMVACLELQWLLTTHYYKDAKLIIEIKTQSLFMLWTKQITEHTIHSKVNIHYHSSVRMNAELEML